MDKKVIAILGATGAQGGALARAILNDPKSEFAVRAVVRDPKSDKAQALAARGAEVVSGDVDRPESLKRAFHAAYGAFCVTFFWAHLSAEKELAQARAQAEAAKDAGLRHVVWSTLEDTRKFIPVGDARMPTLQGDYKVPHFDAKGEADHFFRHLGVPTTFLVTSFYWENLISFGLGPKKGADGTLAFVLPMADQKLPCIAVDDIGKCAYGIFKAGSAYIGKTVGVAGDHLTGQQFADTLTRALGQPVSYNYVPPEIYRTFGFPGADEMGNMFQFNRDFSRECCAARDLTVARSLNPELQTFAQWAAENKDRIPIQ